LSSFELLRFDEIKMDINKTKNFEGVKGIDAELEKIKEKVINPECLYNNGTNVYILLHQNKDCPYSRQSYYISI
jgi:hypothetical protein